MRTHSYSPARDCHAHTRSHLLRFSYQVSLSLSLSIFFSFSSSSRIFCFILFHSLHLRFIHSFTIQALVTGFLTNRTVNNDSGRLINYLVKRVNINGLDTVVTVWQFGWGNKWLESSNRAKVLGNIHHMQLKGNNFDTVIDFWVSSLPFMNLKQVINKSPRMGQLENDSLPI